MQAAEPGQRIAVIGSGVAGLSCAWLLSQRHDVTLYEREDRLGGHAHTVTVEGRNGRFPVDTGFIVYNEQTYPNLTALFAHLAVPTQESDMSFAASLRGGALEYAGTGLNGLFGQRRNLFRARFWSMLRDLRRLYRDAPSDPVTREADHVSLGEWLAEKGYGRALTEDHILPMAAAIWSGPPARMLAYPAAAFLKFFDNHGLLRLRDRPVWRTVTGGSEQYVRRLAASFRGRIRKGTSIGSVRRAADAVVLQDVEGGCERFDHVVIASHAHQALAMLADASPDERALLGAFGTSRNRAVLHADQALMPKRKAVWASWNFIGGSTGDAPPCVTYWMNSLQGLPGQAPTFITLNPPRAPAAGSILREQDWDHPVFDTASMQAQRRLWSLQGVRRTWFCGAWFGAGFHEDGVQAGLAAAEDLGGVRRPWQVADESGRIHRHDLARAAAFA